MIDFVKSHWSIKVAFASLLAFLAGLSFIWIVYLYFIYLLGDWAVLHTVFAVFIGVSNPLSYFIVYVLRPEPGSNPKSIYKIEKDSVVIHPNHKFISIFAGLPWGLGLGIGLFIWIELVL